MELVVQPTHIPEVKIVVPVVYHDNRGFFLETFHAEKYRQLGIDRQFVQDNHSHSIKGVLRGLHYQLRRPQAKLIYVTYGEIYDVAVDIRQGSPTFGQWVGHHLSATNHHQLFIPEGFAHGFYVLSERADVIYKCSDVYVPGDEFGIAWNDPQLNIDWPLGGEPIISEKDAQLPPLAAMPQENLPKF